MRLRFDERELVLLRGAERLRGATLAHDPHPAHLRGALSLARAGQKVASATPGAVVSLDEKELDLLLEALRFAIGEVQWASDTGRLQADPGADVSRKTAILAGFPELDERGLWRTFGLRREMEALADRLAQARSGH